MAVSISPRLPRELKCWYFKNQPAKTNQQSQLTLKHQNAETFGETHLSWLTLAPSQEITTVRNTLATFFHPSTVCAKAHDMVTTNFAACHQSSLVCEGDTFLLNTTPLYKVFF